MKIKNVILSLFFILSSEVMAEKPNDFIAISYHDITTNIAPEDLVVGGDRYTITAQELAQQFQWFQQNGFHPVSIEDLIRAKKGEITLPSKAVLLTFDDGYQSFYEKAFPLLKAFNYPAVLAIVGSWIEVPKSQPVEYEVGKKINREKLMTWDEIKEVQNSGLVEIASHSYALHKGVIANPQGNIEPAVTTHQYFPEFERYETDAEYSARIKADLQKNSELLAKKLGHHPRVMVWPYGATNQPALKIAESLGMPITLTLDETDVNNVNNLALCGRIIERSLTPLSDFIHDIYELEHKPLDAFRTVRVDLDYIYDPDPKIQEENVGKLIQRIYSLQISAVFLQAYADPDGDGNVKQVYFPNRHLPMRADLFNRVAWQLRTRAGVTVFAWMPMMAFDLDREELLVKAYDPETGALYVDEDRYKRLSPFNPTAQKIIHEVYEDLSKSSPFLGVTYHDDGVFSDFEDANSDAFQAFLNDSGLNITIDQAITDPNIRKIWANWKTQKLIELTDSLTRTLKIYNPYLKTSRSLFALPVLNPDSEEWFSQNLDSFLKNYDYTAIMAMPYMENADNPKEWMEHLVAEVKTRPEGLRKSLFELQTLDWRDQTQVDTEELVEWMQNLQVHKAINFGYYPDDFHQDHPKIEKVHVGISKQSYPFRL